MATSTLRPNGTYASSNISAVGAASLHAATSDDSDASYGGATAMAATVDLDLGTVAVPAGAQIRSVTPRARMVIPEYGASFGLYDGSTVLTQNDVAASTPISTYTGAAESLGFGGVAWTQSMIDSLKLRAVSLSSNWRLHEGYVDVVYNERPVVAVTGPADDDAGTGGVQVTTSSRPPVTWTYTDPESDVEERWEARIYATPGGGWGGFDPDTTGDIPAAQSGVVFSSALTWAPTSDIPNSVTYRAYVRAADAGSGGRYSAWAYREFTMALTPPPVPTVAATAQPASGRVKLDVTVPAGGEAASFVVVELSDDAGATWEPARGGSRLAYAGPNGATVTLYDYEPPPRQARQYRAKSGRVI